MTEHKPEKCTDSNNMIVYRGENLEIVLQKCKYKFFIDSQTCLFFT